MVTAFVRRPTDGAVLLVLRSDKVLVQGWRRRRHCWRWSSLPPAYLLPDQLPNVLATAVKQVGTYQHMWGAVSGGIEGEAESPVLRAQQEVSWAGGRAGRQSPRHTYILSLLNGFVFPEAGVNQSPAAACHRAQILEEAGLGPSQVALVRSGRPLLVDDGRLHFAVHPFLFQLHSQQASSEVTLNWENDAAMWAAPSSIRGLDAVPLLAEAYERVHISDSQAAAVQRLVDDRQHGAAQMAQWAVEALQQEAAVAAAARAGAAEAVRAGQQAAGSASSSSGEQVLEGLRNFGWHLACARPSMAAIANSVSAVLAGAHEELHSRHVVALCLGVGCRL